MKGFTQHKLKVVVERIQKKQFYIDPLINKNIIGLTKIIKNELSELSNFETILYNDEKIKITDRHILLVSSIYYSLKRDKIADIMHLSKDAVDQNIKRLRNKMGIETKMELVRIFIEWGLIPPISK